MSIDGVKRGKTAAGPPPPAFNDAIANAKLTPDQVSAVMVVSDIPAGSHVVEFTRDCYVKQETRIPVDKPDDYTVGPIALQHAVASLTVRANDPRAQVVVDGQARGTAPFNTADLCEGEHTVELRSQSGRFFKRLQARTGDKLTIDGVLKPAFALLSAFGGQPGGADLRLVVERLFDPSASVTLFAPPSEQVDQALKANQLPAGWLAFDANKRPMGNSTDLVQSMRRDLGLKLASTFGSQGVAAITVIDRNRVVLSILAAGSDDPDVIDVSLDNADSVRRAIAQLDRMPAFFRPTIGLVGVDVADVTGVVVGGVDPNGPSGKAGIKVGDLIVKAKDQPIADAAALSAALAASKANDDLILDVKDRTGAIKKATVKVAMTPRLIGISDQSLLVNAILVALRSRLLAPSRSDRRSGDALESGRGARARRSLERCQDRAAEREASGWPWRRQRHRAVPARAVRRPAGEPSRSRSRVSGGRRIREPADRGRSAREGPRAGQARRVAAPVGDLSRHVHARRNRLELSARRMIGRTSSSGEETSRRARRVARTSAIGTAPAQPLAAERAALLATATGALARRRSAGAAPPRTARAARA